MPNIHVFAAEREAGLEEVVRSSSSIAYAMQAQLGEPSPVRLSKRTLARVLNRVKASSANGQPDLHYLNTLLVSVGWNKNDDFFDRQETWDSRHSPKDKKFNFEHHEDDIIGHMTSACVVDEDHKVIDDGSVIDDLPEKFHIVTGAVLYKFWEDEVLQERMDTILVEIAQGAWYVSMEALFKGFDYAVIKPDKTFSVVARCEKTAFLTKHLRAYGGDGSYQKNRVGRLLRNITFSGKGLVRKPANVQSIIFDETETFNSQAAQIVGSLEELGYETQTQQTQERNAMAIETELALENKALKSQVDTLTVSLKQLDAEKVKAQEEANKVRDEKLTKLASELAAATEQAKAADDTVKTTKSQLDEALKATKAAQDELATLKTEQKKDSRIAALKAAYGCDDAKATELYEAFVGLNDEQFKAHADYMAEKLKEFQQTAANNVPAGKIESGTHDLGGTLTADGKPVAKAPPKATNLPAPATQVPGGKAVSAESAKADITALETAQPNTDAALNTVTTDDGVEKVRASIADYMAGYFGLDEETNE